MMNWVLTAAVLLVSGCLCCQLPEFGDTGGEDDCPPPYMEYGTECCLDRDGNGVCDKDEYGDTSLPAPMTEETTTTHATPTTAPTTTTSAPTSSTTTTTLKSTYQCVRDAGYDPDTFIYLYSKSGRGCGDNLLNYVKTGSSRSGVDYTLVEITYLNDTIIQLLECFYGEYYEGNPTFGQCPMLLCPTTGDYDEVDEKSPVTSRVSGFAKNCG